jgi:GAF domain-containing protein
MAQAQQLDYPEQKTARYGALAQEIAAVAAGEPFAIARYATAACLLHQAFQPRFLWTGFYLVAPDDPRTLVVGPYQGTLGCLRIPFGKGVCGTVAAEGRPLIVPDVHAFSGHIACDSRSRSEIVLPVFDAEGALAAVLDIDSAEPDAFDAEDLAGLAPICAALLTAA